MDLTPKQQVSEAIRQAESILIVTGKNPNVDQVSSVVALALILRKLGKKVSAVISDGIPQQLAFLPLDQLDKNLGGLRDFILKVDLSKAEVDKLKYTVENGKLNIYVTPYKGSFAPSDVTYDYGNYHYDLVVTLGVTNRQKLDKVVDQNPRLLSEIPIANIDFHRSNAEFGAINLVEPSASSLAEILVSVAESLQSGIIDEPIATCLLAGIVAATDRFTAQHTTPKAMTIAAQMMAAGGKQQTIVKALYQKDQPRDGGRGGKSQPNAIQQSQPSPAPQEAPRAEEVHRQPEAAELTEGDAVQSDEMTADISENFSLNPNQV